MTKDNYNKIIDSDDPKTQKLLQYIVDAVPMKPDDLLCRAIKANNQGNVILLIENGADVNFIGKDRYTPLQTAILTKNESIINLLIENGADITKHEPGEYTPLHMANIKGLSKNIIEKLTPRGARNVVPRSHFQVNQDKMDTIHDLSMSMLGAFISVGVMLLFTP